MFSKSVHDINPHNLKKILIGSVIPRPIALIVTQSENGIINAAPFSYFNIASYDPPILMVSLIRHPDGTLKDTAKNLKATKEGVVHIVTTDILEDANRTSVPFPYDKSELDITNWNVTESSHVAVPYIQEAAVTFEVEVETITSIKQDQRVASDVFFLRIKYVHLNEHIYDVETGYINYQNLNPMSRLAGADYAHLGDIIRLTRPINEGDI